MAKLRKTYEKLREKVDFYEQNQIFSRFFLFFSALLTELHYIKASFSITLEYLETPFCPVSSTLEGLIMQHNAR